MSEEGQGADTTGGGDSPKAPSVASGGSSAASSVASAPPSVTPRLSRPSGDNSDHTGQETPPPPPLPPAPSSLPDSGAPGTPVKKSLQNGGSSHYKTEVCLHKQIFDPKVTILGIV